MARTGRPRKLPPDEEIYRESLDPDVSHQDLAEKYGVARTTIGSAVARAKKAADAKTEPTLPPFPWVIAEEHQRGAQLYKVMNAYRRHEAGLPCTPEQVKFANELRRYATRLGMAVTYDYEKGFGYVNRRPEDGDAMFVVRDNVAVSPSTRWR